MHVAVMLGEAKTVEEIFDILAPSQKQDILNFMRSL
jgi:hypothetical protein